jgi:DNA-binding response OmpR family regulator
VLAGSAAPNVLVWGDKLMANDKKTVLVVEDNQDIAQLLGQLLRAYGCEVLTAQNMDMVEEKVKESQVDLLLLDILLPEEVEDGRKIAENLRNAGHKFPIYFMTGLRPPDVGKEYLGLVNGFLRKPFSLRDLRKVLNEALGSSVAEVEEATSAARDLVGMMASIATEQEEVRRQQARLATFVTILQSGAGKGLSEEVIQKFQEDSARYEDGLARIETSLNEVLEVLRKHGPAMLDNQRRGV